MNLIEANFNLTASIIYLHTCSARWSPFPCMLLFRSCHMKNEEAANNRQPTMLITLLLLERGSNRATMSSQLEDMPGISAIFNTICHTFDEKGHSKNKCSWESGCILLNSNQRHFQRPIVLTYLESLAFFT